jgi:hypothetical protein
MSSVSSFLKFTDQESVVHEWEVLDDPGRVRPGDAVTFAVLWLLMWIGQQFGLGFLEELAGGGALLDVAEGPILSLFVTPWVPIGIALAITAWFVVSRAHVKGSISLTNWRLIYYERGEGRFKRSHHRVVSANLQDIVGIHSSYDEGRFGYKALMVNVHTKYEGGVVLRLGHTGGLLTKIPLIGRWVGRSTIGKDAFTAIPVAFRLVQASQGRMAESGVSY